MYPKGPGISFGGSGISKREPLGFFGVSELLHFEVPRSVRTLRVVPFLDSVFCCQGLIARN